MGRVKTLDKFCLNLFSEFPLPKAAQNTLLGIVAVSAFQLTLHSISNQFCMLLRRLKLAF